MEQMEAKTKTFIERFGTLILAVIIQAVFVISFVVSVNATNINQAAAITTLNTKVERISDISERLAKLEANSEIQTKLLYDILSKKMMK